MKQISFSAFTSLSALKRHLVPFAISTVLAIVISIIILILINASLMKIPMQNGVRNAYARIPGSSDSSENVRADYNAIAERNLLRAKLEVEIPKPKSEQEIAEETLTNIMKNLSLKGVWLGQQKANDIAVIDKGQQKGVWTYEMGEVVEGGLVVTDIQASSVTLRKDDFAARIKLFAKGFERITVAGLPLTPKGKEAEKAKVEKTDARAPQKADLSKEIRNEGKTVVVSKALIDKIKSDNSIIMSSVAVKALVDKTGKSNGFQIVTVDKGSLAEKMGIIPNDIIQEVNGVKLASSDDMRKASQAFKDSTKFELKVLRGNQTKTLYYEIK